MHACMYAKCLLTIGLLELVAGMIGISTESNCPGICPTGTFIVKELAPTLNCKYLK